MRKTIFHKLGLRLGFGGNGGGTTYIPDPNWILYTGLWEDTGTWIDSQKWRD